MNLSPEGKQVLIYMLKHLMIQPFICSFSTTDSL